MSEHATDATEAQGWRLWLADGRELVAGVAQRPRTLAPVCALLIGLCALLYLTQVSALNSASAQLQAARSQQAQLERQDAEAHQQLGAAQNPSYIAQRAAALGLAPAGAGVAITIVINASQSGGQPATGGK